MITIPAPNPGQCGAAVILLNNGELDVFVCANSSIAVGTFPQG